jgi:hypothetical protein
LGRFTQQDGWGYINQDIPSSLNLYTYCWNNPTRFRDDSGNFPVETVLDVVSLGFSIAGFVTNPNLASFGDVMWDLGSIIIPYVPGSYIKKGVKVLEIATEKVADIAKMMDNAKDLAKRLDIFLENRKHIVGAYKDVKSILKKLGANLSELGYEVHHLIEQRLAKQLGIKNIDDGLAIILDNAKHDEITAEFRKIIGYANDKVDVKTNNASLQDIWDALVTVYNKYDMREYLPMLKKYLLDNVEDIKNIAINWGKY